MAETTSPPTATPKRKREDMVPIMRPPTPHPSASLPHRCAAKTVFTFRIPHHVRPGLLFETHCRAEDGSSSLEARVTRKFGDLAIADSTGGSVGGSTEGPEGASIGSEPESGGAVAPAEPFCRVRPDLAHLARFDFKAGTSTAPRQDMHVHMELDCHDGDDTAVPYKRTKFNGPDISRPSSTPNGLSVLSEESGDLMNWTVPVATATATATATTAPAAKYQTIHPSVALDASILAPVEASKSGDIREMYSQARGVAGTKSRVRKPLRTPPSLSKQKGDALSHAGKGEGEKGERTISDPVRASLTWHDDEITMYDPNDKDDDGTGINGIGFRPTAAAAARRSQTRRRQLAEYKKREANEARAKRNQRRRDQGVVVEDRPKNEPITRVRFSDAPPTTLPAA